MNERPAARLARTIRFGDADPYFGAITDPIRRGTDLGAIVWGMGLAQLRAARLLARLGVTTMQIRRLEGANQGGSGVARGLEAMDVLASERGVGRFILMGNCGFAAASFNIAIADERVVGLVLSNPHVSEALTVGVGYRRKLTDAAAWRRLLAGRARLGHHLVSMRLLRRLLVGRLRRVREARIISAFPTSADFTMPANVVGRLETLGARGVHTLLLFAQTDPSLYYFEHVLGSPLDGLTAVPSVTAEVLPTTNHWIAKDDDASAVSAESIYRWAAHAWGGRTVAPVHVPKVTRLDEVRA